MKNELTEDQKPMLQRLVNGEHIVHYGYKLCWNTSQVEVDVSILVSLVKSKLAVLGSGDIFSATDKAIEMLKTSKKQSKNVLINT